MFQFPSNGKVYSEETYLTYNAAVGKMFQFPSNGKVYSEETYLTFNAAVGKVSIPFKRESVFRVKSPSPSKIGMICFNSLQTGKCIQRSFISN